MSIDSTFGGQRNTSEAAEIAHALKATKSSNGWEARCPAHNDTEPSLSISEGEKGKTLLKCHAGCTFEQIKDALTERGLWRPRNANGKATNGHAVGARKVVASYPYRDRDGTVLYHIDRHEGGGKKKSFSKRPSGGKRVLYRWPELAAAKGETELFVTEGEKDCDNLRLLGLVATTVAHGSWHYAPKKDAPIENIDVSDIRGRTVYILEDADEPGVKKSREAAHALYEVAKSIRIVRLPGHEFTAEKNGKDVSDWLAQDRTFEDLLSACRSAAQWTPSAEIALGADIDDGLPWRGRTESGRPTPTMHNTTVALTACRIKCSFDVFHCKMFVGHEGEEQHEVKEFLGELTDEAILALRMFIGKQFKMEVSSQVMRDAVVFLAHQNRFDPVRDMLDRAEAEWDGVPRLDFMAARYFNAEDTPLNAEIMRKTMIAAVRRVRRPGCKFDHITVLESKEGWMKSTAWRILAGDENFSDQSIIGKSEREVQEHLSEVWIHESSELAGMKKAEVEQVKAMASRQEDRARPAYGYVIKRQPRHCINVGTTNSDEYLQSQTGNRRFWPLKVNAPIDIDKLARDRLQLWGEAAAYESKGESIFLDRELWPNAETEQEKRRVKHPWEEILADLPKEYTEDFTKRTLIHDVEDEDGDQFVVTKHLLEHVLEVKIDRQETRHLMQIASIMKRLGWTAKRMTVNGEQYRGFIRWKPKKANLADLPLEVGKQEVQQESA